MAGLTALVALTAACVYGRLDPLSGHLLAALALMVGVALTELRPVHVARRGQRQSFTLTEGPLVFALALSPGRFVVVAVAAGLLIAQVVRRVPPLKLVYNVTQYTLAAAVAVLCATYVPGVGGVVIGIALFSLLNDFLIRLVIRIVTGQPQGHVLQGAGSAWFLHIGAVTSVALIAADTAQHSPGLLPAFLVPALLIQLSQEQANRRQARGVIAGALAQQAATLYGRASQESASLILRSARELLITSEVEIVLLSSDGATSLRDTGAGHEHLCGRVSPEDLLTGWRGRVLELTQATVDGRWAGVVIGRETPHALLSVRRDAEAEPFCDSDRDLLQALADNVEDWLDVEAGDDDAVQVARRRAAELGGGYAQVAEALGTVHRVGKIMLGDGASPTSHRDSYLAEELRTAAAALADFVSDLIAPAPAPAAAVETVHTGQWSGRAA